MKREFFNKQYAALCVAYAISNKLSDESQDVYWEMLQGIPEKEFGAGVKTCLATCKFFPTIAELGEASLPTQIRLSSRWTQTKNGMDRLPEKINWKMQIDEKERELTQLPQDVRKMIDVTLSPHKPTN